MARLLRTERGLDRLVNFSDATVAISITLLLLPLVDVAAETSEHGLGAVLAENAGTLWAAALSFAVIARLWMVHHRLFELAASYDKRLMWINFLWLASIAFLPFASNVIAHDRGGAAESYALYIATILVQSIALYLLEVRFARHPELLADGADEALHPFNGLATCIAIAVALVIAVLVPAIGMWSLLLLFLTSQLERLLLRARR